MGRLRVSGVKGVLWLWGYMTYEVQGLRVEGFGGGTVFSRIWGLGVLVCLPGCFEVLVFQWIGRFWSGMCVLFGILTGRLTGI